MITKEELIEMQDHIEELHNKVGLTPETLEEVTRAIERYKSHKKNFSDE